MRRLFALVLLAAAVGGGWWMWTARSAGAAAEPGYRTAAADQGSIVAVVAATGTVNPVFSVQVGSQLSGQIRELFADFNTRVTRGQPVARLDTATIEARAAAARADRLGAVAQLEVARAQVEKARADLDAGRAALAAQRAQVERLEIARQDAEADARRKTELRARNVGSEAEAERAQFAAAQARASVLAAQAEIARVAAQLVSLERAVSISQAQVAAAEAGLAQKDALLRQVEVDLGNAIIRAPIDGIVVSRSVDVGQTVASSLQSPVLFTIANDLTEMEVWATVDEADIGRVRPGQEVTFTVSAHPSATFRGTVKDIRLAATTVQNVVTYTVVITAPNPDERLLPGMTANARLVVDRREGVLRVPNAALRWRPAGVQAPGTAPPISDEESPLQRVLRELPQQLDLTPAQRAEIEAAAAEARSRIAAASTPDDRRTAAQQARQRAFARVNAVLTPDQRARLAQLRGGRGQGGTPGTVWLRDGEGFRPARVMAGITDGATTEILSGELTAGDEVITGTARGADLPRAAPAGPRMPF